jgi:hypothetical protein
MNELTLKEMEEDINVALAFQGITISNCMRLENDYLDLANGEMWVTNVQKDSHRFSFIGKVDSSYFDVDVSEDAWGVLSSEVFLYID